MKWLESDRRETQVAAGQFSLLRDDDEDDEDEDDGNHDNHDDHDNHYNNDNDIDDMDVDFDDEGKYNVVTHVATFPAPKLRKFHCNERGQDFVGLEGK